MLGAREFARAGFLGLEEVRVRAPGGESFTRVVVRHPGAVVVVPVAPGGARALLVRQFRAAVGRVILEVPAGKRDVDAEPPEETARRELLEELGVRSERLVPLAEFFNSPGFCDEHTHLYAGLDVREVGPPDTQGPEEAAMTVEWVALDAIDDLVASRVLVDAKTIIGLLLTRRLVSGS